MYVCVGTTSKHLHQGMKGLTDGRNERKGRGEKAKATKVGGGRAIAANLAQGRRAAAKASVHDGAQVGWSKSSCYSAAELL